MLDMPGTFFLCFCQKLFWTISKFEYFFWGVGHSHENFGSRPNVMFPKVLETLLVSFGSCKMWAEAFAAARWTFQFIRCRSGGPAHVWKFLWLCVMLDLCSGSSFISGVRFLALFCFRGLTTTSPRCQAPKSRVRVHQQLPRALFFSVLSSTAVRDRAQNR